MFGPTFLVPLVCLSGDAVLCCTRITHPVSWSSHACSFLRDTCQILKPQHSASRQLYLFTTTMVLLNPPNIYQHPSGLVGTSPTSEGALCPWGEVQFCHWICIRTLGQDSWNYRLWWLECCLKSLPFFWSFWFWFWFWMKVFIGFKLYGTKWHKFPKAIFNY